MTTAIQTISRRFLAESNYHASMPLPQGADFFSRTGEWVTAHLTGLARSWTCYEINETYRQELSRNIPEATIVIGDSFQHVIEPTYYDVILADCPQGVFGEASRYCEHFEFMDMALSRLNDNAILFFNVNIRPYWNRNHAAERPDNYGMIDHDDWFGRRDAFYSCDASELSLNFVDSFYRSLFLRHGFDTTKFMVELEPSNLTMHKPFILRCLVSLKRS